jgi:hypothetical protein
VAIAVKHALLGENAVGENEVVERRHRAQPMPVAIIVRASKPVGIVL